jgi:hypothetical protein
MALLIQAACVLVPTPEVSVIVLLGFTVKDLLAETGAPQPTLIVYVILTVPAATAVTSPVVGFTVAIAILLLLQVPPEFPFVVYVAVAPIHKGVAPLIVPADTGGVTVKDALALAGAPQPLLTV